MLMKYVDQDMAVGLYYLTVLSGTNGSTRTIIDSEMFITLEELENRFKELESEYASSNNRK